MPQMVFLIFPIVTAKKDLLIVQRLKPYPA